MSALRFTTPSTRTVCHWFYNVSEFTAPNPDAQQAYEDMAMMQLAEIRQIFLDAGADPAEVNKTDEVFIQTRNVVSKTRDLY